MRFFVSVATYELGKRLGIEAASRAFVIQCQGGSPLDERASMLPAARFVRRLMELGDVELCHLSGSTLPQLRSRASHAALESEADVWVMIDDDVECDLETLRLMVRGVGDNAIVALPCRVRGAAGEQLKVNVRFDGNLSTLHGGAEFRRCTRAGTGCMLVSHSTLKHMCKMYQHTQRWRDEADDQWKVALFEQLRDSESGRWYSEDYSFTMRARHAGVTVLAPITGVSNHDGLALALHELAQIAGE